MSTIFENSVAIKIYKTIAKWYSNSVLYKFILFIQTCFSESYINKSLQKYATKRPKALYNSAVYKIFRKLERVLAAASEKLKIKEYAEMGMFFKAYNSIKNTKHGGFLFLAAFAVGFFIASVIIKGFIIKNLIIACGILIIAVIIKFATAANYKGSFFSKLVKIIID